MLDVWATESAPCLSQCRWMRVFRMRLLAAGASRGRAGPEEMF